MTFLIKRHGEETIIVCEQDGDVFSPISHGVLFVANKVTSLKDHATPLPEKYFWIECDGVVVPEDIADLHEVPNDKRTVALRYK